MIIFTSALLGKICLPRGHPHPLGGAAGRKAGSVALARHEIFGLCDFRVDGAPFPDILVPARPGWGFTKHHTTMRRTYSVLAVLVSFLLFAFSAFGAPKSPAPVPVLQGTDLPVVYDSSGRGELTLRFHVAESNPANVVLPFIGIQRGGGPAGFPRWDTRDAAPAFGGISTTVVRVRCNGTPNTTENVRLHLTSAGIPRTKVYAVERLFS